MQIYKIFVGNHNLQNSCTEEQFAKNDPLRQFAKILYQTTISTQFVWNNNLKKITKNIQNNNLQKVVRKHMMAMEDIMPSKRIMINFVDENHSRSKVMSVPPNFGNETFI